MKEREREADGNINRRNKRIEGQRVQAGRQEHRETRRNRQKRAGRPEHRQTETG